MFLIPILTKTNINAENAKQSDFINFKTQTAKNKQITIHKLQTNIKPKCQSSILFL